MPAFVQSTLSIIGGAGAAAGMCWVILFLGWRPWMKRYPARKPSPDAVRRNFQSLNIAVINGGWTIHVAADESHLHLTPVLPLRWLGAGPISVPWASIEVTKRNRRGTRATAKFDGRTVYGPAWCLDLAGSGDEATA